jgi:sterol desaturase/sphingolipid hydroxylase (fatty acid hydroxylase superfamily)
MGKAIAIATPFFFLLIALELWVARRRGLAGAYRLNDSVNSLSLGVMSQVTNLFVKALTIGLYAWVFEHVALGEWPADSWWTWLLAIAFYDFCYYWNHRLGHESAVFWASHVVHHQSQRYNLSTALRQTSSSALLSWIFYVPMAVAGVPPQMFAVAAIIDLLYQYWIHTEVVGKLGWFDRWFASPSNHRVHHAVNDRYIDRNYGGILMLWDRLFGTFVEESERCVYGTRAPLESWDPLWANVEVYADLARRSRHAGRWRDRVLVWLKPPGWQPVTATGTAWRKPAFDVASVRTYDPPMTAGVRRFALTQLTLVVLATTPLLWFSDTMSRAALVTGSVAVVALLWLTGAVMQGRLRLRTALLIEGAIVAAVALGAVATAAPASMPEIRDDARVQRAVERARTAFMARQSFDRMQVSVLVRDRRGVWRRGQVEGDTPAYPASTVKLGFLVGAVHWCAAQSLPPECLDAWVRPMIVESDNVATGEVVDRISGVTNAPLAQTDLAQWTERRRYTERVLDDAGLLGPQRLFTKTYPTNSGEEPAEAERAAWQQLGRNAMTPNLTAALMLAVVSGTLEPQATGYMRSLLHRPTFSAYSSLGGGLPPGSLHENKIGNAFDTLQDAMYAKLPDGHELVVAAFSNGWNQADPTPGDVATLGDFTARLLDELGLARGAARPLKVNSHDDGAGGVRWDWRTPRAGRYELALWYEADATHTPSAQAVLASASTASAFDVDLTRWGRRWIRLGDVELARGTASLHLQRVAPGALVGGTLRIARWPDEDASSR